MNQSTPNSIIGNAKKLLASPSQFFSSMPKSGGFGAPILFIVAMAVSAALLCALGSIPGQGFFAAIKVFIVHGVLWSVYALFGVLLAAVIFFTIWKLLGSRCSFETAFRCTAYTTVMLPVTILLSLVPVIGVPIGILWAAWLLVCASTAAHGLQRSKPALVFIALGVLAIWRVCSCDDTNADGTPNSAEPDRAPVVATGAAIELEPVKAVVIAEPARLARDPAEPRLDVPGETATTPSDAQNVQLKAANAGKALGELVKGVTDMAINATEDIAKGLDKTLQKALPGEAAAGADQASASTTQKTIEQKATGQQTTEQLTIEQSVKEPVTKAAGEPAFSLESAGETVGALVKSLGEVARDAGQGIQNALDRNASGSEGKAAGSEKAGGENKDGSVAGQAPRQAASAAGELRTLTPEQLGEALGTFINQLNSAASGAAEGFDRAVQAPADASLNYKNSPAQNAGEALGHFLRGFNQAVQALEAQTPPAETER